MFDLEKAISDWRQQWAAAGIKSSEILRELENHLREDIQIQMREGLDVRKRYAIEVALFLSGFICSSLFGGFVLPYFERNLNGKILPAIWLWVIFPIAIFMAAACGIEQAVRGGPSANRPATS
jgi:hypothetical protein